MRSIIFLTVVIFCAVLFSSCSKTENYILENASFQKTFQFTQKKAGAIQVEYWLVGKKNKISDTKNKPYFEFVINGQLVNAHQKLWVFRESTSREMRNGGTEHRLVFEGIKDPVNGLQLVLFQQVFPGSTLIREKLELHANSKSFALNKWEGNLHFSFPCYAILTEEEDEARLTEIRMASFEKKPITFGDKKKGNHMYYPDVIQSVLSDEVSSVKGPVQIVSTPGIAWFTAYEHASQDNLNGMLKKTSNEGSGNLINDAMQGITGNFKFPLSENDLKFLGISSNKQSNKINISVDILRGGYLEGDLIDATHPYSTVWTASGFYKGNNFEDGKQMLRNYLWNQICEKPASRIPEFYYNTWGLQRNDKTKPLRGILTYDRIFEEIDYAADLGVDIFVLDDGWQETQGIWSPNTERLTEGLAPIKKRLDEKGIKLGLWYSPMGIDSTTERYKSNMNWVVKDSDGKPILAQWNHPAFDFVSDFFDLFVEDCKKMIDEGCRFMKWDAINTFYSTLPNLHHGTEMYSEEEIRARYEYLLPIYVVKAMEVLTDYEPEMVIEMDLTEARRVMVGLAPLSQGKLFWMNNGASWYNDYSTFRTQSMRTIANEFAGLIPLELFTYANYPQNSTGNMKYNVHNSLLAGHGFWGNLELMSNEERNWVGEQVSLSKKVLPFITEVNPKVVGKVGDSPEVYSVVNSFESAGQVIVFTAEPCEIEINTEIVPDKLFLALHS